MPTSPAAEPETLPIHTRGLTKRDGATVALDRLDLDVRAGEVYGFLVAYALVPRSASAIAFGLLITAFLWQLFGALLGAPTWLVDVSPFVHLGLTPARAFRPGSAVVIALIGAAGAALACGLLARRDLVVGDRPGRSPLDTDNHHRREQEP